MSEPALAKLPDAVARRRLGVNRLNIFRHVKVLKAEGFDLSDRRALASEVAARLYCEASEKDPTLDPQAIDWDAIIAFIEKLLPLILMLIQMFGGL